VLVAEEVSDALDDPTIVLDVADGTKEGNGVGDGTGVEELKW